MEPNWKLFVDRLIDRFDSDPKRSWTGRRVAATIRDEEIMFLEKALMKIEGKEEM